MPAVEAVQLYEVSFRTNVPPDGAVSERPPVHDTSPWLVAGEKSTVGGAGKTPFAAYVAELLLKRGWKPGILTRGYRRGAGPQIIAVEPAAHRSPDPRSIGDEPAWLAKQLPQVPLVVGANRYQAGRLAEETWGVDVHILDDGFQHLAMARQAAQLASAHRLRGADAIYLAVARRYGTVLVSRDAEQRRRGSLVAPCHTPEEALAARRRPG